MAESKNRNILIFSEDKQIRNFLKDFFFIATMFKVIKAAKGREVLEILQREACDLLIMDLDVENFDIVQLVVAIRGKYTSLPIIGISSGYKGSELRNAGITHFLPKPFTLDGLRSKLDLIFK